MKPLIPKTQKLNPKENLPKNSYDISKEFQLGSKKPSSKNDVMIFGGENKSNFGGAQSRDLCHKKFNPTERKNILND
jgi:hypothetical protein